MYVTGSVVAPLTWLVDEDSKGVTQEPSPPRRYRQACMRDFKGGRVGGSVLWFQTPLGPVEDWVMCVIMCIPVSSEYTLNVLREVYVGIGFL